MLNPNYIVGLVDGEGSFTVYIRDPDTAKIRKRRAVAEPRFYITLSARDKETLWQVKAFFGCGNVYFQKDNRPNHQDCYRYETANRQHLNEIIIPFFKQYKPKMASKKKDFRIFCKLMDFISQKEHLTESGLRKMYKIKQQMH